MENGNRALRVMETHLAKHDYFVDGRFTIADIALYAYTHLADQCGLRSRAVSGGARLARPRQGAAGLRADGLAAGDDRGRIAAAARNLEQAISVGRGWPLTAAGLR